MLPISLFFLLVARTRTQSYTVVFQYLFSLICDASGDLGRMLGLLDTIPLPGKR